MELAKFLLQADREKKTGGKHVILVESKIQLNSAVAFSQYIYQDRILLTLIGEQHEHSWKCSHPSISVADYCEQAVKRNPRCKVLLEYNKGDDPLGIGSEAVRGVYASLNRIERVDAIIPFDVRAFFLGIQGQGDLYSGGFGKYNEWEEIRQTFIEPYFQKQRDNPTLFSLSPEYPKKASDYLINLYVPDLTKTFHNIAGMFSNRSPQEVHLALKHAWKKVVDFYILRDILEKNDDVDEYIIILGNEHYLNLNIVLPGLASPLNKQEGSPDKCVNLYQSYHIT